MVEDFMVSGVSVSAVSAALGKVVGLFVGRCGESGGDVVVDSEFVGGEEWALPLGSDRAYDKSIPPFDDCRVVSTATIHELELPPWPEALPAICAPIRHGAPALPACGLLGWLSVP